MGSGMYLGISGPVQPVYTFLVECVLVKIFPAPQKIVLHVFYHVLDLAFVM
jgi:hypothetical protein